MQIAEFEKRALVYNIKDQLYRRVVYELLRALPGNYEGSMVITDCYFTDDKRLRRVVHLNGNDYVDVRYQLKKMEMRGGIEAALEQDITEERFDGISSKRRFYISGLRHLKKYIDDSVPFVITLDILPQMPLSLGVEVECCMNYRECLKSNAIITHLNFVYEKVVFPILEKFSETYFYKIKTLNKTYKGYLTERCE